jgi:hypothetical protein
MNVVCPLAGFENSARLAAATFALDAGGNGRRGIVGRSMSLRMDNLGARRSPLVECGCCSVGVGTPSLRGSFIIVTNMQNEVILHTQEDEKLRYAWYKQKKCSRYLCGKRYTCAV